MKAFLRENALTLFFVGLLLLALGGQSVAGLAQLNSQQVAAGQDAVTYGEYLLSSDFVADVAENWQSEFLQFFLYVLATVWFVQRGSTESKEPGEGGLESGTLCPRSPALLLLKDPLTPRPRECVPLQVEVLVVRRDTRITDQHVRIVSEQRMSDK